MIQTLFTSIVELLHFNVCFLCLDALCVSKQDIVTKSNAVLFAVAVQHDITCDGQSMIPICRCPPDAFICPSECVMTNCHV